MPTTPTITSPSPVTTPLRHLSAETLEECRTEFSVNEVGSLLIRGNIVLMPHSNATRDDIALIVAAVNGAQEITDVILSAAGPEAFRQNAGLIPPAITEAQVLAWFKFHRDAANIKGLRVGYDSGYHKVFTAGLDYPATQSTEFADSLSGAIELMRKNMKSPAQQAADKRAAAAKLLAEADALAPQNETRINAAGDIA